MNIFTDLAAGAAGGVFSGIGGLFKDIRSALGKVDPDKAAEVEERLAAAETALLQAQMAINLEDAKSNKWWQAGWRPAVAWVCAGGLAIQFMIEPLLALVGVVPKVPFDSGQLMAILVPILGLGAYRTYEKKNGVN